MTTDLFPPPAGATVLTCEFTCDVALSLTQPWATLYATGNKKNETRGWATNRRGWFAIHASKGFPGDCKRLVYQEHFRDVLARIGYESHKELPCGIVLAVARIADCTPTEEIRASLGARELAFGDYSDRRYAFVTDRFHMLKRPFECKGALGFWKLPRRITEADVD